MKCLRRLEDKNLHFLCDTSSNPDKEENISVEGFSKDQRSLKELLIHEETYMPLWSISCVRDSMVIHVKRSLEGKESYSLKYGRERLEDDNRARSSLDTRNLNPYDEEMDGRSRKHPEHEHDNEGRKDKRDLQTKFTKDDGKYDRKHKGEKRQWSRWRKTTRRRLLSLRLEH